MRALRCSLHTLFRVILTLVFSSLEPSSPLLSSAQCSLCSLPISGGLLPFWNFYLHPRPFGVLSQRQGGTEAPEGTSGSQEPRAPTGTPPWGEQMGRRGSGAPADTRLGGSCGLLLALTGGLPVTSFCLTLPCQPPFSSSSPLFLQASLPQPDCVGGEGRESIILLFEKEFVWERRVGIKSAEG